MYNAELKNRFLMENNIKAGSLPDYLHLFKKSSEMENRLGMDLCQITDKKEIEELFKLVAGVKKSTMHTKLSKLRRYAKWCLKNNIEGATDTILNVEYSQEERFAKDLVGSADDLNKYLNTVFDKEIKKSYDNVFRCYYWLAFIGVNIDYVYDIKNEEVDLDKMQINHNGKTYEICKEAFPSISNCVMLDSFVYSHPNYSKDICRPRVHSNQLMRGIKQEAKKTTFLGSLCRKLDANQDRRLSYERVLLSGVFCRLYEIEQAKYFPLNFRAAAEYYLSASKNEMVLGKLTSELSQQYEVWKKVFKDNK